MKILHSIKSAALRTMNLWKGALIIWFLSLLLVSMLAMPIKGALNSGFGKSMITEKLADGLNFEVFADMGAAFRSIMSFFSVGLFMAILVGFILNAFFTGGVFERLKESSGKFSAGEFFRASAKNFWSFLVISLIISLIILVLAFLIIGIPLSIVGQSDSSPEGALFQTGLIVLSIFFLLLTILLLVADYARAWQVTRDKNLCFKAIGFGFSQTFKTFLSSFPLMIILLVVQLSFGWLILKILPGIRPATGGGVFHMFLLSQILFFLKIMLKIWRYGNVTSLMEISTQKIVPYTSETD
jgi:putative exporter of polyketide antibiotics